MYQTILTFGAGLVFEDCLGVSLYRIKSGKGSGYPLYPSFAFSEGGDAASIPYAVMAQSRNPAFSPFPLKSFFRIKKTHL